MINLFKKAYFILILLLLPLTAQLASNTSTGFVNASIGTVVGSANPGDTIIAFDGVYPIEVWINKSNIMIVSDSWIKNGDNSKARLIGTGTGNGMSMNSPMITIQGFTFINLSRGIRVDNAASNCYILNNSFLSNHDVGSGAAIRVDNDACDYLTVTGNSFISNYRAIWIQHADRVLISNNTFNLTEKDSVLIGISGNDIEYTTIVNNVFSNSIAWAVVSYALGGANYSKYTVVNNNFFFGNYGSSFDAAGLRLGYSKFAISENNWFVENNIGYAVAGNSSFNSNVSNHYASNYSAAILIYDGASDSYIASNEIFGTGQTNGIRITNSQNSLVYRNLIRDTEYVAIDIYAGSTGTRLINNTLLSSISSSGVFWRGSSSGEMYNNIFLSNSRYGVEETSSGIIQNNFNLYYGNNLGNLSGSFTTGGTIYTTDPLLNTANYCEIISSNSEAFEGGTVISGVNGDFIGIAPDVGWLDIDPSAFITESATSQFQIVSGIWSYSGNSRNANSMFNPLTNYLQINGGATSVISIGSGSWSTNVDTRALPSGTNIFIFSAVNNGGGATYYHLTNIVDNGAVIKITNTLSMSAISNSYTFAGLATNKIAGMDPITVSYSVNGGSYIAIGTGPAWTVLFDTKSLTNGKYVWVFRAVNLWNITNFWYQTNLISNEIIQPLNLSVIYLSNSINRLTWTVVNPLAQYSIYCSSNGEITDANLGSAISIGGTLPANTASWDHVLCDYPQTSGTAKDWYYAVVGLVTPVSGLSKRIILTGKEITLIAGNGNPTNLYDESDASGDPPSVAAVTFMDDSDNGSPSNYIDLGETYHIDKIYLYRSWNANQIDYYGGVPGSWSSVASTTTNLLGWALISCDFTSRYVMTSWPQYSRCYDIAYYGYSTDAVASSIVSGVNSTTVAVNNGCVVFKPPQIGETNSAQLMVIYGDHIFSGYATNINTLYNPLAVYFSINGGVLKSAGSNTLWSTNIDTTLLSEGTNIFTFIAVNNIDQTNIFNQTNIVDNSAPITTITSPTNSVILEAIISITGSTVENYSAIVGTTVFISNNLGVVTNFDLSTGSSWSVDWDTMGVADGQYYVYSSGYNDIGFTNYSTVVSVIVDNSYPIIQLTNISHTNSLGGSSYASGSLVIAGISTNQNITLANTAIELIVDATVIQTVTNSVFNFSINTLVLADGVHEFIVYSTAPNNRVVAVTNQIVIDNSAPIINITQPDSVVGDSSDTLIFGSYQFNVQFVEDTGSFVSGMVYIVKSGGVTNHSFIINNAEDWSQTIDTFTMSNDDYTIVALASNINGFISSSTSNFSVFNIDANLNSVIVGPNPFLEINSGTGNIVIQNVTISTEVEIFSVNGESIIKLSYLNDGSIWNEHGQISWDLRDNLGRRVGLGVYIVQIFDSETLQQISIKTTIAK